MFVGLDPELSRKHRGALLVVLDGLGAPALLRVQAHDRAMRALLQRLEAQRVKRGLQRALQAAIRGLQLGEPLERPEHRLVEAGALRLEPLVERRLTQSEPVEQGPAEQRRRALEREARGLGVSARSSALTSTQVRAASSVTLLLLTCSELCRAGGNALRRASSACRKLA